MNTEKPIFKKVHKSLPYNKLLFFCLGSIILLLTAASGCLFYENRELGDKLAATTNQLAATTREKEMLDAEVPDAVIKYSPLLVGTSDPRIKELAMSLGGPKEIYLFVRDNIEYSVDYDQRRSALEVLDSRKGDCLGKSNLLTGLLLAYGYSDDDVEVNMGHVTRDGERRHHAWVELNMSGKWIVLDSSQFLGTFEFDRWDVASFYSAYNAQPHVRFNDRYVHLNLGDRYMRRYRP